MTGIHRYETFGLHAGWIAAFFQESGTAERLDYLGPRQRVALRRYLVDAGMCDGTGALTLVGQLMRDTVGDSRWSEYFWSCTWANLCTTVPIFAWYASLANRVWTNAELLQEMESTWPGIAVRTLRNALSELLGTLRYTPIGSALGQASAVRADGQRAVEKHGPARVSPYWVLYCIVLLSISGKTVIVQKSYEWGKVAQILGVDDEAIVAALTSLWRPDLYTISQDESGVLHICLAAGLTPEAVLQSWIVSEGGHHDS